MHRVSDSDRKTLEDLVGAETVTKLIELDESIQAKKLSSTSVTSVQCPQIVDRQKRGAVHHVRGPLHCAKDL